MGITASASLAIGLFQACAPRRHGTSPQGRGLRVTRVSEDTRQPGQAGCMRISGRLADVCAELERLARAESL